MAHIRLRNVNVDIPVYDARPRRLISKEVLLRRIGGAMKVDSDSRVVVSALHNITLDIEQGDRLCLVGHNGAGKTTLLRVLSGIYPPTDGTVEASGRVTPIFNISLGMEMDATGYENIHMMGRLLGLTNEEITATLADSAEKIDAFLLDASGTAEELRATVRELRGDLAHLMANADATLISARATLDTISDETAALGGDARALITDLRGSARSLSSMSEEIQGLVADSRTPLSDFTAEGLYEFARLITEMRTLVASLTRIADGLESDPTGYLFGNTEEGFKTE